MQRKTQAAVVVDILGHLEPLAGGRPQALVWFWTVPISALGGLTAQALVAAGEVALVRNYLEQFALGGFA